MNKFKDCKFTQEVAEIFANNTSVTAFKRLCNNTDCRGGMKRVILEPYDLARDSEGHFVSKLEVFPKVSNLVHDLKLCLADGSEVPLRFDKGEYVADELTLPATGVLSFIKVSDPWFSTACLSAKEFWMVSSLYSEDFAELCSQLYFDKISAGMVRCSVKDGFLCDPNGVKLPPMTDNYFLKLETEEGCVYFKRTEQGYMYLFGEDAETVTYGILYGAKSSQDVTTGDEFWTWEGIPPIRYATEESVLKLLWSLVPYSEMGSFLSKDCKDRVGDPIEFVERQAFCNSVNINTVTGIVRCRAACVKRVSSKYINIVLHAENGKEYPIAFNFQGLPVIADVDALISLRLSYGDEVKLKGTFVFDYSNTKSYFWLDGIPVDILALLMPRDRVAGVFKSHPAFFHTLLRKDVKLIIEDEFVVSGFDCKDIPLVYARKGNGIFVISHGKCIFSEEIKGRLDLVADLYTVSVRTDLRGYEFD